MLERILTSHWPDVSVLLNSSTGWVNPPIHPFFFCFIQARSQGQLSEQGQLLLLMRRSSGSIPSSSQVTELLTISLRERPATLQRKLIFRLLVSGILFSRHKPKFMTIGEGRNVDWPVNRELGFSAQLFTTTDQYNDRITTAAAPICLSISHSIHSVPRGTWLNAYSKSTKHMWIGWANSHEPSSTLRRV